MRKILLLILSLILIQSAHAATMTKGKTFGRREEVTNAKLHQLVDSGTATIGTGEVGASEIAATAVTAGSYTNTDLTVDADGRITAASNGTGSDADTVQFTITEPDQLDEADRLVVWSNESSGTFTISSIKAWSDDAIGNIQLHARDSDGGSASQLCDISADTAGTNVYYGSTSAASDTTVTTTQQIYFDYVSGTPDYLKITVVGSY